MLQYHKAGTVILLIVIVVALMDLSSAKLREKLI
jgi:ABC-type phosphate/phosphonate transport system permease subunit